MRNSTLLWLSLAGAIGGGLFYLKYDVQGLEKKLESLNEQVAANESAIHVLNAEWSYLNQPDRLADLSRRHLRLGKLDRERIATFAELPLRFDGGLSGRRDAGPATLRRSRGTR